MSTFLDEQRDKIKTRMDVLRPLVDECQQLEAAEAALTKEFGPIKKIKYRPKIKSKPDPQDKVAVIASKKKRTHRRYSHAARKTAVAVAKQTSVKNASKTYGIPQRTIHGWLKAK